MIEGIHGRPRCDRRDGHGHCDRFDGIVSTNIKTVQNTIIYCRKLTL
ncbi:hypothetical protein BN940_08076 [Castellaniella defragrans 65Phen]|uniref:Uncharacterized protein n=1 Tax=Castellaniella defragrans (strain DSM 12143 / CCUG 39792 / 65Phen) TaxID=1437824 RepID=W8WWG5_CASD6|nr:hypothetical protein BN940_08076 [Castellaniella defragrans 65Phen]